MGDGKGRSMRVGSVDGRGRSSMCKLKLMKNIDGNSNRIGYMNVSNNIQKDLNLNNYNGISSVNKFKST